MDRWILTKMDRVKGGPIRKFQLDNKILDLLGVTAPTFPCFSGPLNSLC